MGGAHLMAHAHVFTSYLQSTDKILLGLFEI